MTFLKVKDGIVNIAAIQYIRRVQSTITLYFESDFYDISFKSEEDSEEYLSALGYTARRKETGGAKVIEVRKISTTQIDGVSLFLVFYNGICKKVYARNEKEAEEKVRALIENS